MEHQLLIERINPSYYRLINLTLSEQQFGFVKRFLSEKLSFKVDNYYQIKNSMINAGKNADIISEYKNHFKEKTCSFGIGFRSIVINELFKRNYKYKLEDFDLQPKINIDNYKFNRYYQKEAVQAFFDYGCFGIIKSPTGSGKTYIAIKSHQIMSESMKGTIRTLMIVKSAIAIKRDVKKDLEEFANFKYNILDNNLNLDDSNFLVITIQTLLAASKKSKKDIKIREKLRELYMTTEFLIVDEGASFSTFLRKTQLNKFNRAYFRLFLSATPYKKGSDINKWKILETQYRVIYKIQEKTLVDKKFLSNVNVIFIKCDSPYLKDMKVKDGFKFNKIYDDYISNNHDRNLIIDKIYEVVKNMKLKTVFLIRSIEYGRMLKLRYGIPFVFGKTKIELKEKYIDGFIKGKYCLIASSIFNEGVNIPEIEVIVNCSGGRDKNLQIQKKGRVMRKFENKKKIYIDIIDFGNEYVEDHSLNRIEAIEETVNKNNIKVVSIDKFEKTLKDIMK